jgi:MFS family permease
MPAENPFTTKSTYSFLWGICLARLFLYLGLQNYATLIPLLQKDWGMSGAAAGSIVSAFSAGFLISLVGLSALTDWVSTRKVFLYSCMASGVTALLFAIFARDYYSGLLLRGLMGLAVGGVYTPGLKLISETFTSSMRGRAMGLFLGAGSLGLAGSVIFTGWIAASHGWAVAFVITALGPVLGGIIPYFILRGLPDQKAEAEERRFKKELLSNKPALLMITGYTAHVWELEGMRAWTSAFLVACLLAAGSTKSNALQTGATLSSAIFFMGVFSTGIAGYLSDRWGRTVIIIVMMIASILCSFSFGWMIGGPVIWIVLVGLCYGFTVIAESPVFSTGLTEVISPNYLGTALSIRSLVGYGVGVLVPTVFGAFLDWTNPAGIEKELGYLPNWGWAFTMLGIVGLIGPLSMFKLRSMPESKKMGGGRK